MSVRRTSMKMLQDLLGIGGASRTTGNESKRKLSLKNWAHFKSVDWTADAKKDYDQWTGKVVENDDHWFEAFLLEAGTWVIPALVGALTATSGWFIEKTVEWFGDMRFGYCPGNLVYITKAECGAEWVDWSYPYLFYIFVCTALCTVSALMTWAFAPMARGSGIPEVKTVLGGFFFPEVLEFNTLVVKIVGLSLSVAAGLSCGKEGPMVHIGCCWSHFMSKLIPRYRHNEAKQRELLSAACAAGVAVAFGAPLGGVLFSLEEASTIFPNRTMVRSFFAASVAAVTLNWWNATGSGKLTMFEANYNYPPKAVEYIAVLILGIVGGCVGALFVHYNILVSKNRAAGTPFRQRFHIVLEVAVIGFVTAITSYPLLVTKVLSNTTIRALFHDCGDMSVDHHTYLLDLCDPNDPTKPLMTMELCWVLLLAGFLRWAQLIFTFGTGAPAGLFIPSLYVGAALGRVTGIWMYWLNEYMPFTDQVSPIGMYAMIGAASVLGGVCRVTISLVVIMFELTGGLQLICPFMLSCMAAKWVGDYFTPGIYDYCIQIRGYPYLHEPDEVTYITNAGEIMDEAIDCIHPEPGTVGSFQKFLKEAKHGGYPLTQSSTDHTLLGFLWVAQLREYIEKMLDENPMGVNDRMKVAFSRFLTVKPDNCLDLSNLVDESVLRAVPETPAVVIHKLFRNMGIKQILITRKGDLVGMITKKSFITHMEELHHGGGGHGHGKEKKEGGLQAALLPK